MGESMIHKDDAEILRRSIQALVDNLDEDGFDRAHVGAAMVGIGAALVSAHTGHANCLQVLAAAGQASALTTTPHDDGRK